jgi:hypothetical protein
MDRYKARETVVQLVESDHDRRRARGALTRFEGENQPPQEPGAFPNLDAFLDFHDARCEYEDTLQGLQTELESAEDAYNQAERTLASILPPNRALHYDYDGEREEFAGARFTIEFGTLPGGRRQMMISSYDPSPE